MTTPPHDPEDAAVRNRLDLDVIDQAAAKAADQLRREGLAAVLFSPGDMTAYRLFVVDQARHGEVMSGARFVLCSNFGPLYPLPDPPATMSVGYAAEKYLDPRYRNFATAVVYAEFVNRLWLAVGWPGPVGPGEVVT